MVMSENERDFSRVARRKNRAMFVRPQKVAFGETSEVGRKGRELKEPLVSPAVSGSLNTWSQGFPKTRNRKYNFFPHLPPPPPPGRSSPKLISSGWRVFLLLGMCRGHLRAKYHHLVKLTEWLWKQQKESRC